MSLSPKFHSVSAFALGPDVFELRHFETSAPNDPKMTLNTNIQGTCKRYTIHVLLVHLSHKFETVSLYDQAFSSYKPF